MSNLKTGLTAKGKQMPQTKEEFQYMGELYEKALLEEKEKNSKLRHQLYNIQIKLEKYRKHDTSHEFYESQGDKAPESI